MFLGILLGRYVLSPNAPMQSTKHKSFFDHSEVIKEISIDDTKVVLDINTNNLEKKFTEISKSTETENTIKSSIDKLKNMKGK